MWFNLEKIQLLTDLSQKIKIKLKKKITQNWIYFVLC